MLTTLLQSSYNSKDTNCNLGCTFKKNYNSHFAERLCEYFPISEVK